MSATNIRRRKGLRRAGLILGLLLAGVASFCVWALVYWLSTYEVLPIGWLAIPAWALVYWLSTYEVVPIGWLAIPAAGLIIIGSVATAWKWELIGGILLIAEGLFMSITGFGTGTFLGLLILVPGVLFLVSWWIGRSPSNQVMTVEGVNKMSATNIRRRKWLRRAGLIVGLLLAGGGSLFLWAWVYWLSTYEVQPIGWLVIVAPGLIIIGSVATASKWELIGGILLIGEGLFMSAGPFGAFPGLLLLVPGVLFLVSWWIGQSPFKTNSPVSFEGER